MKNRILECFRENNSKAGSPLDLEHWKALKNLGQVEEMHAALVELSEAGLVELRRSGIYLTDKGEALISETTAAPAQPNIKKA